MSEKLACSRKGDECAERERREGAFPACGPPMANFADSALEFVALPLSLSVFLSLCLPLSFSELLLLSALCSSVPLTLLREHRAGALEHERAKVGPNARAERGEMQREEESHGLSSFAATRVKRRRRLV